MDFKRIALGLGLISGLTAPTAALAVDLSGEQTAPMVPGDAAASSAPASDNPFSKPWFQRVDIGGQVSANYIETGKGGSRPNGSFRYQDIRLFVTGQVWKDVEAYLDWDIQKTYGFEFRESYINFKNVLKNYGDGLLSVKLGRFELPFGEEYLRDEGFDNYFVQDSAAWPWGEDEGIEIYGKIAGVGYILAHTEGFINMNSTTFQAAQSDDSNADKAWTLKLYGQPTDFLYLSGSYHLGGRSGLHALEFGNNFPVVRVGFPLNSPICGALSTAGCSGSGAVELNAWEVDANFKIGDRLQILNFYGQAEIDDPVGTQFDRTLSYFSVEPIYNFTDKCYLGVRYSQITSSSQGYALGAATYESGYTNAGLIYNVQKFASTQYALGYMINDNTRFVLEYAEPQFKTNPTYTAASGDLDNRDRSFFGAKVAVKF